MSTNCFHFSNHICGFRGSETPQGTSKQLGAKHAALHLEKTLQKHIFFVEVEQAQCTCSFCHMSYVSLLEMSICKSARENWLEWELEGRKMWRDRRKPSLKRDNLFSSPDERQSFLTRDNGLGLEVICEATNHWHLTPPKCDGRALTNQTEIWPNFPLYICQIYCQSLDWFLLLGHKETE